MFLNNKALMNSKALKVAGAHKSCKVYTAAGLSVFTSLLVWYYFPQSSPTHKETLLH